MARTTKPLTDTELRNAKPKEKEYSLSDGKGLLLLVMPIGSKLWRLRYKHPITENRKLMSLGQYPDLSLAEARKKRDEALTFLASGLDPKTEWEAEKVAKKVAHQHTFKVVAEQWLELKRYQVTPEYAQDIENSLKRYLYPKVGKVPVSAISAQQLIQILKPVEAKGSLETVRRLCQRINEVLTYAAHTGLIKANPASNISKAFIKPKRKNLPSVAPKYLPNVLAKVMKANLSAVTRGALMWSLYAIARPTEASNLQWEDIDEVQGWVKIPAERMKRRRDHYIPLTPQMVRILADMKPINGDSIFVFSSPVHPNKPLNSQTVNSALKRSGLDKVLVAHGMRSIASTALNDQGFDSKLIEMCLAHAEENESKSAYDRATYIDRRRPIMSWWNDFVDEAMVKALKGEMEAMPE